MECLGYIVDLVHHLLDLRSPFCSTKNHPMIPNVNAAGRHKPVQAQHLPPLGSTSPASLLLFEVFLKGQLTELFGALPALKHFDHLWSFHQLCRALDCTKEAVDREVWPMRARLATEEDWPQLRQIWREHHHLVEMVDETSQVVAWEKPSQSALKLVDHVDPFFPLPSRSRIGASWTNDDDWAWPLIPPHLEIGHLPGSAG